MSINHPLLLEIQKGESTTLEFKKQLPKGLQVAKTLIAFANTSGGKLVVGVDDQQQLLGIQGDIFEIQEQITSMTHELCMPNILPFIYVENIDGIELLVVEVGRGALLPYYLKSQGREQGTYIRLGSTNRQASLEYIQQLELQRLNQTFDEQANLQYRLDDINLQPLQEAFSREGKELSMEKMRNFKLLVHQHGQDYPSHGLLILLGLYEQVEIKCSRFKGNTMTVFLDKKEYRGGVFSQLEQTEQFIKNHLHLRAEITGLQRTEQYEIPIAAIREALVNAVLHRDYSNAGRDIKVGIYDDMLNIVSPGGLPHGLTEGELLKGRSEIRNRVIARVFKELGYIEQWGSGILRIKDLCSQAGNAEPKLSVQGDFVDWAFYRPSYENSGGSIGAPMGGSISGSIDYEVNDKAPDKKPAKPISDTSGIYHLTARQQEILQCIRQNPRISYRAMAQQIGINESAIKKHLNNLKAAGWLERVGGTRGHWEIKKK